MIVPPYPSKNVQAGKVPGASWNEAPRGKSNRPPLVKPTRPLPDAWARQSSRITGRCIAGAPRLCPSTGVDTVKMILVIEIMVEAAGVEPASGNLPLHFLRTYLLFWISLLRAPGSRIPPSLSCKLFASLPPGLRERLSCLNDAPEPA